jgi:hypothetical protein
VAAIFAQMRGYAIRTCGLGHKGGAQRVWPSCTPRVADGCHVINVYAQAQMAMLAHFLCLFDCSQLIPDD